MCHVIKLEKERAWNQVQCLSVVCLLINLFLGSLFSRLSSVSSSSLSAIVVKLTTLHTLFSLSLFLFQLSLSVSVSVWLFSAPEALLLLEEIPITELRVSFAHITSTLLSYWYVLYTLFGVLILHAHRFLSARQGKRKVWILFDFSA